MGCLENTGIPSPVNDSNLENIFCRIVDKVGVSVIDTDIKDCHGVSNKKSVKKTKKLEEKCQKR